MKKTEGFVLHGVSVTKSEFKNEYGYYEGTEFELNMVKTLSLREMQEVLEALYRLDCDVLNDIDRG